MCTCCHAFTQVVYDEIPFEWIPVFNEAVERVGLLEPAGPFRLLDLYWLAHGEHIPCLTLLPVIMI